MVGEAADVLRAERIKALLLILVGIGISSFLGIWIVGATSPVLILGFLGLAAGTIVLVILGNWRTGVYLFFLWLLFEDLARKYLGNNMVIYFGKDVLAVATYVALLFALRRREAAAFRPPFLVPLVLFFWLGVLQVFNPSSPSFLYGLLGMKLYYFYIPLMFVGYAFIRAEKDLHRFLLFNLALAGLIALLGIIQSIVGKNFLNPPDLAPELRALGELTRISPITRRSLYRPTSVFVSDGRFAWYLILMWIVGLGTAGYLLLRTRRGRATVFLAIALVTVAIIQSGSRGAVMWTGGSALVIVVAFFWGAPWRHGEVLRVAKAVRRALLLAALGVLFLVVLYPEAIGARWAFYSETLLPSSPKSELVFRATDYPITEFVKAFSFPNWPLGYGIGTSSLGIQYIERIMEVPPLGVGVESGYGTLVLELGVPGLLLWVIWTVMLAISGWRAVKCLRGSPLFPVGFAFFWFAILLLFGFTYGAFAGYQNFVYNAYLWLLVGVLFRLPTLLGPQGPPASRVPTATAYGR